MIPAKRQLRMDKLVGRPEIMMVDNTLMEPKLVSSVELIGSGRETGAP